MEDLIAAPFYDELVQIDGKPDCIIPAGTNPLRPIMGYACKALIPFGDKPIIYHTIKHIHDANLSNKIFVISNVSAMKQQLVPYLERDGIDNVVLLQEGKPGDAEQMVKNIVSSFSHITSKWSMYSVCDVPGYDANAIRVIFNDISKAIIDDTNRGRVANIYTTIGDITDYMSHCSNLERKNEPGLILSKYVAVKTGNFNLLQPNNIYNHTIKRGKEILKFRKFAELRKNPFKFLSIAASFGYQTLDVVLRGLINFAINDSDLIRSDNKFLNSLAYIFKQPFKNMNILNISLDKISAAATHIVGTPVRVVKTIGSADIDNDKEFITQLRRYATLKNE
ncbi:MAG: NTP transferase domain-containing protein [Nanoarchaeota archaeon]|nr:NTP transferase domain-containing protein [Nanoarchaeota archaeon]